MSGNAQLPKKFKILSHDNIIKDIKKEYPTENFLDKLENKLRELKLDEDIILTLLINSTAVNWPAFASRSTSTLQKSLKNENIENLRQYTCKEI